MRSSFQLLRDGRESSTPNVASAYSTSLPLTLDLRLRRTGARLAQRGSTEHLVLRALTLPRRAPPPLWKTSRAATQTVAASTKQGSLQLSLSRWFRGSSTLGDYARRERSVYWR